MVIILVAIFVVVLAAGIWKYSIDTAALKTSLAENIDALRAANQRFSGIDDVEQEILKRRNSFEREISDHAHSINEQQEQIKFLKRDYLEKKAIFDRLSGELASVESELELVSYGLYKPHYTFEDPEAFKEAIEKVYEQKKDAIKRNGAIVAPDSWTVNGSTKEGTKLIKQQVKLMLRGFNAEVDAAVANVSWNNVTRMEERIKKSYESINDLGSIMEIRITSLFLNLALSELRLSYELERRKQEIKEEQRAIREQMREEELAQREFEKAKKAAEDDEAKYQKALDAARKEAESASVSQMNAVNERVRLLEQRLADAQSKLQRAVSMAQLTRSGHVYVISNIGSFGEDVYKIGMTRRLEPTERIYELGSASVPFPYDIHAMMYTEDAPGLEHSFHEIFSERRVNMINPRKEFFRVSLSEIEKFATTHDANFIFTKLAEAKEYRQTKELLENILLRSQPQVKPNIKASNIPDSLDSVQIN